MVRLVLAFVALLALALPRTAGADPADVDAAARGVVRVVIVGSQGGEIFPVSHGSGFAVTPTMILTNAHVVREAMQDDTLRIGIVPSQGEDAAFARAIAVNPRTDLALVEIVDSPLRLPPLTLAGEASGDMGEVSAVGYPMNVDRAQGLEIGDIFRAQPPVKSRGFLSGARPSRQFDSILHTAPIARGNSGGPLLDGCGRVLGVNSFGADSEGGDAEFYFAVSNREVLPFLRENGVQPRVNALPCRSLAELDADERAFAQQQQAEARARLQARDAVAREQRAAAARRIELQVLAERDNALAIAVVLFVIAVAAGLMLMQERQRDGHQRRAMIAAAIAGVALLAALAVWFMRPGLADIDSRIAAATADAEGVADQGAAGDEALTAAGEGTLLCTLEMGRSRITGARTDDIEFEWAADGCVNTRTQYGLADGVWSRVLVPDEEDAVSVNSYDPDTRTFRTDRYLLGRSAMEEARSLRAGYRVPRCGVSDAGQLLGERQQGVLSILPASPNERLVYSCAPSRR